MSILHRRAAVIARAAQATPAIPAWVDLMKLSEPEAIQLAQQHGITETERMPALQALNAKAKAHENS